MRGYTHLKWKDRLYLERLLRLGYKKPEIAEIMGFSLATIYNEINRGTCDILDYELRPTRKYDAYYSQQRYENHLKAKGPTEKILKDERLAQYVSHMIGEQKYSPDAVLMEIRNNKLEFDVEIHSVGTIYTAIKKGYIPGVKMSDLPHRGKKKTKKNKVEPEPAYWKDQKGKKIDERPSEVSDRLEFGHWEMDSVIGKHVNKKTVLVLTERKTRTELIEKMKFHTQDEVVKALNRIEKRFGSDFYKIFKTITVDNGPEFKDYMGMEKALRRVGKRTEIYYCHPRSPNERGTNENNNILLRRYKGFEKGANFDKLLTYSMCKDAEHWINTYPRRTLDGCCSLERFNEELRIIGCKQFEY